MKPDLSLGITTSYSLNLGMHCSDVINQYGLKSVWIGDDIGGPRDIYTYTSTVLSVSPNVEAGIGIVSPFYHNLSTIARSSATITELHGERLRLGLGVGGLLVMMTPTFSDVIDESVVLTNKRSEGLFSGFRFLAMNFGRVLSIIILAVVHEITGFIEEGAVGDQPVNAILGIKLHTGVIPGIVLLISVIVFWIFYDLTPKKTEKIKKELKEGYFKDYAQGKYRVTVRVLEGEVAVMAPHEKEGPDYEKAVLLPVDEKLIQEIEIK